MTTTESIPEKVEEGAGFDLTSTNPYLQGDEYYRRAESFYDKANYADAIRNFDKAAEYFRKSGNTLNFMEAISGKGVALDSLGIYNQNKYHEAIFCFNKVIKICKDNPTLRTPYVMALHMKGYSLGNLSKYDEALECFEDAIDPLEDMERKGENPDHTIYADILRNKAYAYAMLKYNFEDPSEEDWKKATECLERAEKMASEFAYLWNTHGYINLIYKREKDAIECFDKAIEIDPKLIQAWYNKGYALSISSPNEHEEAIKCFDEAIKIDPNLPFPRLYKGYALLRSGELDRALENFDKALEIDPSLVEALISKGRCLILLEKYQQAYDCFVRAFRKMEDKIEKTPEVPTWYFYMLMMKLAYIFNSTAIVLNEMKKYDEGEKEFDNAINAYEKLKSVFRNTLGGVNPEIARVLYYKGYYLGNLEKYPEAMECFNDAKMSFEEYFRLCDVKDKVQYKTDYANILRNIGFVYSKLDDHAEARKYFQMATREDPNFGLAWNSKGYHTIIYYHKLKEITSKSEDDLKREAISDFVKAIECFQKKGQPNPNIAYAFYNKGYAYFLLEKYRDAIQCFEEAIKVKPNYAEAWHGKCVCNYLLHSKNKSRPFTELIKIKEHFDEAISSDTKHNTLDRANTFYNKAILLNLLGRYEETIECFDQAIAINNYFYESWYSKGIILNYLRRYKQAIECFDQAIKYISDTEQNTGSGINLFDLYTARGQAKYNIGDHEGALKDFKQVEDEKINDCKKSLKYNNIGVYFHQDGDYKTAQLMYEEAITRDPALIDAHYNLAVLHINKNEIKEAKKSFDKCLNIEVTEHEPKMVVKEAARKAKQKLEDSGKLDGYDWYGWWFGHGARKAAFGIVLIAALVAIASPLIVMPLLVGDSMIHTFFLNYNANQLGTTIINSKLTDTQTIAMLTIIVGVLVGMLLLPSLQKFKLGTFEFDSLPPSAKHPVDLDPIIQIASPLEVNMPFKYQPQSFTMPLKYRNLMLQQPPMPIDPVRMPRKVIY